MKTRIPKIVIGKTKYIKKISINKETVFLFILFVTGIIIGSSMIKMTDNSTIERIKELFIYYLDAKKNQSIFQSFYKYILFSALPCFLLAFISGFCAIGMSGIPFIPLLKGISLGVISGYLYNTYLLNGVEYCLLIIFPCSVIYVAALLMACKESFYMSCDMFSLLRGNAEKEKKSSIKLYCTRFAVLSILLVISSIIETISVSAFSRFFSF